MWQDLQQRHPAVFEFSHLGHNIASAPTIIESDKFGGCRFGGSFGLKLGGSQPISVLDAVKYSLATMESQERFHKDEDKSSSVHDTNFIDATGIIENGYPTAGSRMLREQEQGATIVGPTPLSRGEYLRFDVHMVVSNHTVVPFRFYDLPGCMSPILARARENYRKHGGRARKRDKRHTKSQQQERDDTTMSNIFFGNDVRRPAPFSIRALQDQPCTPLCHTTLNGNDIRQLRRLIQQRYRVQMTYRNDTVVKMDDGKPGFPLGFFEPSEQALRQGTTVLESNGTSTQLTENQYSRYKSYKYGYYNHFEFRITYRQDRDATRITKMTVVPVSISHKYSIPSKNSATRWQSSGRFDTCRNDRGNNGLAAVVSQDPENAALWLPSSTRTKMTIVYSYQVRWIRSTALESELLLSSSEEESIPTQSSSSRNKINNCVDNFASTIVMLLAVIVPAFVFWTTRRKHRGSGHRKKEDKEIELRPLTTYLNDDDKIDPKDLVLADFDWTKDDEADLFVATPLPPMICQLSGLGAQLFVTINLLLLASSRIHYRPIILIVWCTHASCGFVSGFVSSRLQELFLVSSSDRWMQITWHAVAANIALSMTAWAFLVLRDILLFTSGAATLSTVGTLFVLIGVTTVIQIPLVICGVYFGHRSRKTGYDTSHQSIIDHSVSTLSSDEGTGHVDEDDIKKRMVKQDPKYITIARNLVGGVIPFGAMHREWFTWTAMLWSSGLDGSQYNTCQIDLSKSLGLFIALCVESCVIVNCVEWSLKREQYAYHHQWWRSFWHGASVGIFFFMYLFHVAWKEFQLVGLLSQFLYLGMTAILSLLLGLVGGFFGVLSSLGFALYVFYYKKNGR